LKVGVLGAGGMGRTVIGHLQQFDEVENIIAYDINEESFQQIPDWHKVTVTTELKQVLDNAGVRVVFVTAPNRQHKSLTLQSIEAGKAVLCEKPMATTLEDAHEMVEAAERGQAFLQIGFELR